jgi:hypothetical protein
MGQNRWLEKRVVLLQHVKAIETECFCSNDTITHRHAIAVKKTPNAMKIVSDELVKIVNYNI